MVIYHHIGDWSNGMIGVSKTFGGSSILSSPAKQKELWNDVPKLFTFHITIIFYGRELYEYESNDANADKGDAR